MPASSSPPHSLPALAAFGGAVTAAAALGASASLGPKGWYRRLSKSPLTPPDRVFGPVWTTLYGLTALSGWRVWRTGPGAPRRQALRWWGTQLALNAAWSPLFFGRHRPRAALADIGALLAALVQYTRRAARVDPTAAWLMAPTLAWVGFASFLNAEILRRNPRLA